MQNYDYLIGLDVKHKKYGTGRITEINNGNISVSFDSPIGTKKFVFPDAFWRFLILPDGVELPEQKRPVQHTENGASEMVSAIDVEDHRTDTTTQEVEPLIPDRNPIEIKPVALESIPVPPSTYVKPDSIDGSWFTEERIFKLSDGETLFCYDMNDLPFYIEMFQYEDTQNRVFLGYYMIWSPKVVNSRLSD